jgi:transcriptional regulator with XRE-family HTH domain
MTDDGEVNIEVAALGARLHKLRGSRNWTLDDLAALTGLSAAYLSRLEAGDRQPSIASLLQLARAYNLTLSTLFEPQPQAEPCNIVRGSAPLKHGNGLDYVALTSPARSTNLQPIRIMIPTDSPTVRLYQHDGEEWLYVVAGMLELTISGETHTLFAGDAAHFDARCPHSFTAHGHNSADVILVSCAAAIPPSHNYTSVDERVGRPAASTAWGLLSGHEKSQRASD